MVFACECMWQQKIPQACSREVTSASDNTDEFVEEK
jgi:hypothetical protein